MNLFEIKNTSIKKIINKWRIKVALIVIEKKILKAFTKKYTECKICSGNRSLKRYYEIKDKLSNQRKLFSEKKIEINYLKNKNTDR